MKQSHLEVIISRDIRCNQLPGGWNDLQRLAQQSSVRVKRLMRPAPSWHSQHGRRTLAPPPIPLWTRETGSTVTSLWRWNGGEPSVASIAETQPIFKTACETSFGTSKSAIFLVGNLATGNRGGAPPVPPHRGIPAVDHRGATDGPVRPVRRSQREYI
jgi:hypothetical protein